MARRRPRVGSGAGGECRLTLVVLGLQFAFCAALIAAAGRVLCSSAERIALATGLTGGWVGLALLATVTSLPELASGIGAVAVVDAPNLAVGNALGACVFNLVFLVVVDVLQRRQPIYRHASPAHLLSAAFGVVMLGFVAMSLLLASGAPALLHLGLYSPVLRSPTSWPCKWAGAAASSARSYGVRDDASRDGGDARGAAPRRARHGDGQSARQQPL